MKNLERLASLLEKNNIEVDSIELAESLWLSKYISKTEPISPSKNNDNPTIEQTEQQPIPTKEPPKPPSNLTHKQLQKQKRKDAPLHPISDSKNKSSLPFRTPLVRRLYKDNDLIFAFRHFRQKIVSLKKGKLDEEKIADYMAKTDIFRPFYQKSYEKRFRIIFMVDSSDSMKIWESLIDEFVKDVKNYHIFKEVTVYYLSSDHQNPKLYKKKSLTSAINEKWYRIIDPNSITFMFSDMLSKAWSSGELLNQISSWQNYFPFAIVQMLPQRLWNGTKLIDASMGKISSQKRFVLNSHLVSRAEEILQIEEEISPKLIKLPLLNFSEDSIDEYGKVMRSLPNNQIEGALFEAEDFRGEYQPTQTQNTLNAEQRLRAFYKYASTQAKTLLELLAVVPLSLPVIKLVQQKLLPQSTQEHLSEIFMSSIIDKEQKVDGFYQFSKLENEESGVREELIKKIGARKAFETITKLSEVIKRYGGVFDFLAFVVDPDSLKESSEFSEIDREFARISVSVLHEMGGKYCDWADRLVEYLEGVEEDIKVVIPDSKRNLFIMNYDFEIGKYSITFEEYDIFCKVTNREKAIDNGWGRKSSPVINVDYYDAEDYCKWLSLETGEDYRLPTYDEWEYCCRAGTYTQWSFGDNEKELDKYAWYNKSKNYISHSGTHPVGKKLPNPWGLYDVHGNVWEWCEDNKESKDGTFRGGSWFDIAMDTRSHYLGTTSRKDKLSFVGFRLFKKLNSLKITEKKQFIFSPPKMIKILNSLSIETIKIQNKNYEMGKYPITIAEYMHFAKDTDSHYPEWVEDNSKYKDMNLSDNAPIIGVSWYDAVAYCEWLSKKTGKIYRLPSEEEWEYSARAGTTTRWSFGDDKNKLDSYAWYDKNSKGTTHIVGKKLSNPWGLYDIHGNVWEWCDNWYDDNKDLKAIHGGSFYDYAKNLYCFRRLSFIPDNHYDSIGFRVLLELEEDNFNKKDITFECKKCFTFHRISCHDLDWEKDNSMFGFYYTSKSIVCSKCNNSIKISLVCPTKFNHSLPTRNLINGGINLKNYCCSKKLKIIWLEDELETVEVIKNRLMGYCSEIIIYDSFITFTNELEKLEDTSNTIIIINIRMIFNAETHFECFGKKYNINNELHGGFEYFDKCIRGRFKNVKIIFYSAVPKLEAKKELEKFNIDNKYFSHDKNMEFIEYVKLISEGNSNLPINES